MMDELKMKLSSKFMRGIVAKIIAKAIYNKLGYEIDIQIDEISVKAIDGKVRLYVNAGAEMTTEEFTKVLKSTGLD